MNKFLDGVAITTIIIVVLVVMANFVWPSEWLVTYSDNWLRILGSAVFACFCATLAYRSLK